MMSFVLKDTISMSSNESERHAGGMPPSDHADHILDLGPGGGVNGGEIVAEGTPEKVAAEPKSFTGQYLAPLLARSTRSPAEAGAQAAKKTRRKSSADKAELLAAK